MKEKAIKKINTMGKVGNIIAIIALVLMCLGVFGCTVGAIALAVLPEDFVKVRMNGSVEATVDLGAIGQEITKEAKEQIEAGISSGKGSFSIGDNEYNNIRGYVTGNLIKVVADGALEEFSVKRFALAPFAAIFSLAGTIVVLCFAGALCRAFMKCQSPFEETVLKNMNNLAISMIPWVIVNMIVEGVLQMVSNNNSNFNLDFNFTEIITVLIVFALVFVFKYGAMLQQESDETL